jgi:hypothetical protein
MADMFKKSLSAGIAAAALCGSVAYVLAVPGTEVMASGSKPGVKGDRLDIRPPASACSQHAWPYYSSDCVRDLRHPERRARAVRVVSADRSPLVKPAVHTTR